MGTEVDHLPASNAEVKKEWSYTFTSSNVFMECTGITFFLNAYADVT
jgi:hypothetical protein